jgi:acyl carrier protein
MTRRSFEECRRVIALAISGCSLPSRGLPGPDAPFDTTFAELGFDSLAYMEFCIAIQGETGIELSVGVVSDMGSPDAVAQYLSRVT